jgi:hypothetical protein
MKPILIALKLPAFSASVPAQEASPFSQRGYYITFMQMPTYNLADRKRIVRNIHDDGCNMLLLWVAGVYRSQKFPITWVSLRGGTGNRGLTARRSYVGLHVGCSIGGRRRT